MSGFTVALSQESFEQAALAPPKAAAEPEKILVPVQAKALTKAFRVERLKLENVERLDQKITALSAKLAQNESLIRDLDLLKALARLSASLETALYLKSDDKLVKLDARQKGLISLLNELKLAEPPALRKPVAIVASDLDSCDYDYPILSYQKAQGKNPAVLSIKSRLSKEKTQLILLHTSRILSAMAKS